MELIEAIEVIELMKLVDLTENAFEGHANSATYPLCAPKYIKQTIIRAHRWVTQVGNVTTRVVHDGIWSTRGPILGANTSS